MGNFQQTSEICLSVFHYHYINNNIQQYNILINDMWLLTHDLAVEMVFGTRFHHIFFFFGDNIILWFGNVLEKLLVSSSRQSM
jgi:hypothetical protein